MKLYDKSSEPSYTKIVLVSEVHPGRQTLDYRHADVLIPRAVPMIAHPFEL
jgi:hypothetical protein